MPPGRAPCELQVAMGAAFEAALEVNMELVPASGSQSLPPKAQRFTIEMAIDMQPEVTQMRAQPCPQPNASIRSVDMGADSYAVIQNMPTGRHFLIAAVADLGPLGQVRSSWALAHTLPASRLGLFEDRDIVGRRRGRCVNCSCTQFKMGEDKKVSLNSNPDKSGRCRVCACPSQDHVRADAGESGQGQGEEAAEEAKRPQSDLLPAPSERWDALSRKVFTDSQGKLIPDDLVRHRRSPPEQAAALEAGPEEPPAGEASPAEGEAPPAVRRVSVVCPTMERRQVFHEQLWQVFESQAWPDKELIVVESYVGKASPFFTEKSVRDDRLVYLPFRLNSLDQDMSIGLKRNLCTLLATGDVLANFDDDDLYAPSYLSTMVEALQEKKVDGVTLGCWYIFDDSCGRFGHVDPVKAKEEKAANAPENVDEWLYGYGFSYVFRRQAAAALPYSNRNFGEDYEFFNTLRLKRRRGVSRVALVQDTFGICVHTLHKSSTSNNWAQREVDTEELQDMDVALLGGSLLSAYMHRSPKVAKSSEFIAGGVQRKARKLRIYTSQGEFEVSADAGMRTDDVLELLTKQVGTGARSMILFRPTSGDQWLPMGPKERLGLRADGVYAHVEDREVVVAVADIPDGAIKVEVRLPHFLFRMKAVREALVKQHGRPGPQGQRAARGVRLADRAPGGSSFIAVDLESWLGDRREFRAPGLAELLGEERDPNSWL